MGGGGPGGGFGLERSTSSSFFAASNARLLRASSCNCLTSPSLKAKRSRMGTPACLTINSRDTRVVALSLGDVLGSLASSETSVLTYSHVGICRSSPNSMERLPRRGPRLGCRTAMQARTLLIGRCLITIIVGVVPVVAVDLSTSRVPPRLGLVQQPLVGIPPSF